MKITEQERTRKGVLVEDLLTLAKIFGLQVLKKYRGSIPSILVEGENGHVLIEKMRGRFYATERIDGVPMVYAGMGSRIYCIDI